MAERLSSPKWTAKLHHSTKCTVSAVCIFILAITIALSDAKTFTLSPGVELYDQQIHFGEEKIYHLSGLVPNEDYEVRTSSPGLYAAEFFLAIICDVNSLEPEAPVQRKLLNVEKAMFSVDAAGFITRCPSVKGQTVPSYGVKVFARLEGTTTDPTLLTQPISYNIALESLWLGIPVRVTGMILFGTLFVLVLVGVIWTAPGLTQTHPSKPTSNDKLKST
jgi:hypothetical protein